MTFEKSNRLAGREKDREKKAASWNANFRKIVNKWNTKEENHVNKTLALEDLNRSNCFWSDAIFCRFDDSSIQ